jgi:hypothetical protein
MQDFTGVPAVVDLAAMRDAMKRWAATREDQPAVPVDLVIDHSVMVDNFGTTEASKNVAISNTSATASATSSCAGASRPSTTSASCRRAPASATRSTSNTSRSGVDQREATGDRSPIPTRWSAPTAHHHGQRPGRARLGRRRHRGRGRDARPAQSDADPRSRRLQAHRQAARRRHRHRPGAHRHADAAQEGRGRQVRRVLRPRPRPPAAGRPRHHRQHGAGIRRHLRLLPGRRETIATSSSPAATPARSRWSRPMPRRRACGATSTRPIRCSPTRWSSTWHRRAVLAGPKRPQDRVALRDSPPRLRRGATELDGKAGELGPRVPVAGANFDLGHGDVVIAAITSCTNTSNPAVMIGAGLLARNALAQGPEAQAVGEDLAGARLAGRHRLPLKAGPAEGSRQARLQPGRLRLHHLHRQFRPAARADLQGDQRQRPRRLRRAVGQPQLRGPRPPDVKANYLASPPLVVAYALAGTVRIDLTTEPLGLDKDGKPVYLKDIWPTQQGDRRRSSQTRHRRCSRSATPTSSRATATGNPSRPPAARPTLGRRLDLRAEPALLRRHDEASPSRSPTSSARACWRLLGDKITTDHISPAGSIKPTVPAGKYLMEAQGVAADFNSYGRAAATTR